MTESFKPALLERLEPRILLSGDGLPIAPTPQSFQDTIDGTQQVIERKAFIEVDESVEQQFLDVKGGFCLEVDPSDQYDPALFPPMVTLSVEEGNALEESEVDDVKIDFVDGFNEISFVEANGDIGTQLGDSSSTPQDTCGLTVVAETAISQEVTTNSLYIAVENKSTPIHENNADSSNEFSTSIKVRGPPTEIVFVDSELKHDFELKNDVFSDVRLFMLPADGDGIQFISDVLSRYENLSAVHIVTHGAPGKIVLGDEILDIGSISRYSDSLSTWRNALTPVGDILFYGCSVGAGQVGRHFVQQIAAITGADMAFSNDPTGNVDFGGDWVLERNTGPIEATLPLAAETLADFDALLCITSGDANVIDASKDDAENSNSVNDITGLVWHDLYRSPDHLVDGIQDAGEPGLEGVTVNLLDVAGHLMVSTTADEAGVYQFTNLNSGTYIVEISPENFLYGGVLCGWYATFKDQGSDETRNCDGDRLTHRSDPINLGTGENRTDVDFGFFTTSINLTKTGPETAQAGETITYHFRVENTGDVVQHGGAHVYDPMINPTGNHRIWNGILQPGQVVEFDRLYTTTANDVGELVNTALAVGHPLCPDGVYVKNVTDTDDWTVTVTPSPFKGSIGDFIWHDLYHDPGHLVDGIQDFGEPGIGEVIVNLLDDADNLVRSTKTDTNGHYRFMNLTAGTYVVEVASENFLPGGVLEGWYATLENQSGNETIDSDGDPTTYRSDPIILTTDELNTNVNFGFFTTGIDLTKTGPDTAQAGETITYHFRVENTGDVVQDGGAQVYDPMLNPDGNHRIWDGVLQPGQVVEFDWMYTTTANEVGELVNTATASGCPIHPDGFGLPKVSDVDSWIVQVNAYTVGPVVTVDTRLTNDSTPELTGTLNDPDAVIEVIVDGNSYNAVNNGDGTWTLLDDTISPALVDGTYDVVAVATDLAGNIGTDQTIDELTIDTTAPVVTVDFMLTNDPTPELTGTVDDPDAAIEVIVDGYSYTAINLGGGYWMLIDDTIDPALADGTYDIVATATDLAGNSGSDTTIDELTVNTAAPLVTVDTLLTNDPTPELTGTVDDPAAVVDVTIDGNTYGATNNGDGTWTLPDDTIDPALADGIYNILVDATDLAGNIGTCDILALTIDTQPPLVSLELDPATDSEPIGDDQTNFEIINLIGTTEPDIVIQLYREGNLSVPVAQTASDNAGAFMFVGIPLNMGDNLFAALATDSVGNQGQVERTIVREGIILIEGSQFEVTYEYLFTVPSEPSHLSFNYDVTFDTSDDFINDAFEVALLDNNGNTLVHTIAFNRDAAFNITEGQIAQLGANTLQNGQTVQIDLTHIPADTEATLVLRLVNNDTDTATTVEIYNIEIVTGGLGTPLGVSQQIAEWSASQIVDFDHLSDVTGAVRPLYGATSFNNESSILYADLGLQNNSHFVVDGPLIAVIDHLSDPGIQILNADGLTPEGLPYFEMTHLLSNGSLEPGAGTTDFRTMAFENPSEQQFTYDLIILGHHNNAPIFVSEPDVEALPGKPYIYDAEATDLDGDTLAYSLITSPSGMTINDATGEISWSLADGNSDLGTHDITVWVEDGRGGSAEQRYHLDVIAPPPNRPPVFISVPITECEVSPVHLEEEQLFNLGSWQVLDYETVYDLEDSDWIIHSSGSEAVQQANSEPTILLSTDSFMNVRIKGELAVETDVDDDWIGFVFGYQDPSHFYIFEWRQIAWPEDPAYPYQDYAGMRIRLFDSPVEVTPLDRDTLGTIETLFLNDIPWEDNTGYHFTLDHNPGLFTITIKQGETILESVTIADSTYTSGKFGFYNCSQNSVRYSGFTQQAIPEITYRYDADAIDPDDDPVTYRFFHEASYSETVLADNPQGYWRLGELPGTLTASDASAYGLTGNYSGSVSLAQTGALPGESDFAARFDGGVVSIPDQSALRPDTFTMEAWVNPNSLSSWASIMTKSSTSQWNDGFGLAHFVSGNDIHFFIGGYQANQVSCTLPLNEWSHLAATYDGSTMNLYLNGALAASRSYAGPVPHSNNSLRIGSGAGGYPWSGRIDEAAFYDRALLTHEVAEHYSAGLRTLQQVTPVAPVGMKIDFNTGMVFWTPTADQIGEHRVIIEAADDHGDVAFQEFIVTVLTDPNNHAPIIVSEPVTHLILPQESDEPGQLLDARSWLQRTINWDPPHGSPHWTFDNNGTIVTQHNNAQGAYLASNDIVASAFELEGILRVNGTADDDNIGILFGYQDSENFYLFNWRNDLGSNQNPHFTIHEITNGSWKTLYNKSNLGYEWKHLTDYFLKLRFIEGSFTLEIWEGNTLFESATIYDGQIKEGGIGYLASSQPMTQFRDFRIKEIPVSEYTYDVEAVDADSDPLAYSLVQSPIGMAIDPVTGVLTWLASSSDLDEHEVTVRVEDGRGGFDEQSYTLRVDYPADLTIAHVDRHLANFDGQLLTVTGQVSAEITNNGPGDIAQPFDVLFFEDRNYNELYDERLDSLLGKITVNSPLLAGQSTTVNADLSGFVQFSGTLIWGFVDSKDTVLELDETNNLAHSGEDCKTMPLVTGFDPVVELHKNTFSIRPGSIRIVMTPAVVDVNEDGIPDIVFITCGDRTSPFGSGYGPLRTISGDTGAELWTVMDDTYDADGYGGIAAGDIDSDGLPEIIANHMSGSLIAFEHDGTFKWQSPPYWMSDRSWGSPSLADLDGDGTVEIISGASVFNADGTIRWEGNASGGLGRGDNGSGPLSAVADLDLDGVPEVIAGRTVYRNDGSVFWDAGISDGFPGIGNFDADLYPEIVLVSQARVYLLEHTGTQVWNTPIPGGGEGGAPTIADMDGDGEPEIGVAGASNYVVFETDGSVKWQSPTSDASSRRTGSSVFDFEGDGQAEVIYGDEYYLRIYRGTDGQVLYELLKGSATTYEYPLIVDVDADGNAEIVAVANSRGQNGIYVIGDANDTWVSTRQIWNQHTYHITNVNDDGTIPTHEQNSWEVYNTYRLNTLSQASSVEPLSAPNLTTCYVRPQIVDTDVRFTVRIGNGGAIHVPAGVDIAFYDGNPNEGGTLLGVTQTTQTLEPGHFEDVSMTIPLGTVTDLWIRADDDGTGQGQHRECNEDDNLYNYQILGYGEIRGTKFKDVNSNGVRDLIAPDRPFNLVRIGDVDGFGFDPTGLLSAQGTPVDTNGNGLIEQTEFLPDLNQNGYVAWGNGDNFDHRSPSEQTGNSITGAGYDDNGTNGSQWTDIALSTDFPFPNFPDPTGTGLPNEPRFEFRFSVPKNSISENAQLFFNVVFGDYDVVPAQILVTRNDGAGGPGSILTLPLSVQPADQDGLVQSAYSMLNFADVFNDGGNVWIGYLDVELDAPNEPYTAFDYVELSLDPISPEPDSYEPGLSDWVIYLDQNNNGQLNQGEHWVITDGNGNYIFTGLPGGEYYAREAARRGWQQTAPAEGVHVVTIADDQVVEDVDFGNVEADTTINDQPYFSSDPITDATTWFKYIYRSRAIDPDGDPLTYDLPVAPEGMAVHPELGVVAWIPTADQIGTHQVVLRAKDDTNGVALQAFQVEVSPANIPPVIVSTPNLQAVADLPYQYTVIAQDPEGEIITYGLAKAPAGMTINSANGVVSWIPTVVQVGIHEVIVSATDERGAETLQAYDLEVLATAPNDPPAIVSTPRTRVRLGNIYGYWVHANDPNGDPLTYSLIENPAGMTIESQQGIITWIPSADQFGTHPVQVQVSDGRGGVAEQSYTIQVTTSDSNTAPTITSDPKASAVVGQLYAYDLIADDPDGDPVAWSLIEAPLGVSINEQLGTLRWTSTLDQLGSQTITIEAMDPFGATDQQTFDITVRSTNIAPQILSVPPTQATVDQPYTYAVRAQDVEGDVLAFSLTTAPAAMSIDPETGIIEWTPTIADVGDHAVSILVDDGNGGQGTQSYTLVVAVEAINQAPTITSRPKLNAPSELLYEYQVTAIDPEGGVIEYYLLESPAGMTIDRDTGLIQWTPAVDQDGDHTIHIAAIDTEGAAGTQRYTLGVAPNQPPTINSTAPTSVTAGMTYRYAVMATDPEGDDLTYHLIQGPAGLTLNTFGLMNWQTEAADLGSYEISVEVRDPAGASDSQTYTLTVAEDTTAPVVTLTASGSLADPGDSLTFRVRATDNVGLESVVLLIDGQMHTLDFDEALYRTDITFETPGLYDVVARAADVSGNQGFSETLQVRVFDPADNAHPVVIIHSPEYQAMITYLTDVVISVHDDNLAYWKVEYAPANKVDINQLSTDDPDYILLAEGTEPLDNEVATVFDPTILANDAYVMRVTAYDVNGTGWVEPLPFGVSGNAKLGNFTFTVSDVSIPLVGIPITINRTYDTLQAGKLGDFGYGWSLGFADANIGETTPAGQEMQPGDRVYLTDPYGQRVGFTYEPTYQSAWFFGLITYPAFTPDPGVTSTVTVKEGSYGVGGILGSFGGNWNPSQYILTLADGTIYEYIQNQGLQKITDRNGNVVSFTLSAITHSSGAQIDLIRNPQGRIVEIIDPAGNPLKYTYDAAGDLLGFTNQIDETITYEYLSDPAHFLDAIYNTEGTRIFKAEFDEDGRLSSGTDALGNVTQQDFDTAVMMGTITDAGGNVTELYYDERGNVLRKIEPAPNPGIPRPITLYSYDDPMNPDRPTSITGPDGIVKYLTYDGQGNKIKEGVGDDTWFYTYDDFGNMVSETDPEGNISLHQYDGKGNLVAEVDASGFSTLYSRDEKGNLISVTDPDGRLTRFEYNELGQGIRMMEPSGLEWSYSYNFNGEATDISYTWQNPDSPLESFVISTQQVFDHSGQLVERIDETGIRTNAEYDGNGNVITFVDEKGNVSSFIYNSRDELVQESYADGNIRRKVYDKFGRVEYETDYFRLGEALPNGTRNYYDALGRITTVERLEDVLIDLITLSDGSQNTIFLSSGEVISSRSSSYDYGGRLISSIDERGGTTLYEYDYAGRLRVMIDPLHNRTEYQYDKAGRKVLEIDALGRQTQFVYDNKGQLFRTVFHDGTWIEKAYDPLGRVVCEIDQDGEERTFEYNTQDNITAVILSPVIDSELGVEVQPRYEYQYDVYGNLKSIRDPKGRTTYYTYDQFGRQLTCTLPDGQIEIFGYNAYDEIIRHIDFDGRVREYVYDELGRETERRISANESNAAAGIYQQIVTTSYDNFGRRHLVQDSQYGSLEFDYNVDNQLTQITSQEGIINYEYNATTGDRIRIYSDYTDIRYSYDVMGRLETVTAVSAQGQILTSPQVTTYRYTPIGMIDSIELPNGCLTQYTYNDLDRLVNLTNLDPQGGVLSSYEYTLAPDGQRLLSRETRLEEDESVSAVEIEWDYDALDRLIRESSVVLAGQLPERSYTKEYIYDIVGNRIKMATTQAGLTEFKDYFYNDNDQLLSKVSSLGQTTLYQYDHCGNLLSKEVDGATIAEHSYGANGLLETASAYETTLEGEYKKVVARYVYDADGNRVSQTEEIYIDNLLSETVESVYLMDRLSPTGVVQVLEQRDDSGIPTRTYIAGDDIVAQIRVAPDGNQEILYFGYDGLGSTRLLLGSTGEIQYRYDFDAYGNSLGFESRDAGTTLLFAGEHYDTSSLLYYLRNRLYDESIGRFTQPDPYTGEAEIPLSLHKYIYVQNNPIMFTDPLGLWPEPTPMGIGRKVHKEIFDDFDAKFPERIEGWSDRAIITILWDCGIPNLNVLNALKRPDLVTKPKGNNPGYVWEIKPGGLTLGFWAAQGSIELYGLYLWSLNSAAANAMASIWWGPGWYAVYKPPSPVVVYGIPYNVWQIGGMIFYSNTAVTSIQLAGVLAIIDAILTAMSISQNVAPAYATVGG